MTDKVAGVEFAGLENDRLENDGPENDRLENDELEQEQTAAASVPKRQLLQTHHHGVVKYVCWHPSKALPWCPADTQDSARMCTSRSGRGW